MVRPSAALFALAGLLATATPAFAAAADGDWACTTLMGFEPAVYVALKGNTYVLTRLDAEKAKGAIDYTDSPIIGFFISGPWKDEFDVVEATMMGDDRLIVSSSSGGIGLMCEPGPPGK